MVYLGCFREPPLSLTTDDSSAALNATSSIEACGGLCREAGLGYAGEDDEGGCRCGRLQPWEATRRPDEECEKCQGDNCDRSLSDQADQNYLGVYFVKPEGNYRS